jgi:cytochrome c biogenesis protein CcdA/thiol-disulfide isomerase/thioredoxin
MRNKIFFLLIFTFLLSFFSLKEILASEKVEIYFFWGQGCPHCAQEKPFLEELKQKYPQLEVKEFEVYFNRENQELFQKVAQAYNTQPEGVPMTFIGKDAFIGFAIRNGRGVTFDPKEGKEKDLEEVIQKCLQTSCPSPGEILAAGGIDKWKPGEEPSKEEPKKESKICIHYFVKDKCSQCQNLEGFLQDIAKKYEIDFKIYNVSESEENLKLYQKLQDFYGISFSGFPIVFLGDTYLVGDQSIKENIEKVILRCQKEGCPCPVEEIKQTLKQIPKPSTFTPEEKKEFTIPIFGREIRISSQSSLFFLGTILGLADGINPCMFSVLLFLLTYLLAIGSKKRAIKVGLVFTLGVFVIYFLFMLGMINLISLISFISKVKIIIAVFAFIASLILIKDFFAYGKGISLEIPESAKPTIEKLIKKGTIPSAILLALLSSLVELPCTVGIPLVYTTILAERVGAHIPYLIWYNFFFIVPLLIIIIGVSFAWAQVDRIEKWRLSFRKYMRLVAGLILLFLSIALLKGWM